MTYSERCRCSSWSVTVLPVFLNFLCFVNPLRTIRVALHRVRPQQTQEQRYALLRIPKHSTFYCLPIAMSRTILRNSFRVSREKIPYPTSMSSCRRICYVRDQRYMLFTLIRGSKLLLQRGSPCQDLAGKRNTRRPPDHGKETQTAVVWTCLPFIRSGQNHLARHIERGKTTGQTEEEVGRQHQGMDRPGVRQVPEGSAGQRKMEKTGREVI